MLPKIEHINTKSLTADFAQEGSTLKNKDKHGPDLYSLNSPVPLVDTVLIIVRTTTHFTYNYAKFDLEYQVEIEAHRFADGLISSADLLDLVVKEMPKATSRSE